MILPSLPDHVQARAIEICAMPEHDLGKVRLALHEGRLDGRAEMLAEIKALSHDELIAWRCFPKEGT